MKRHVLVLYHRANTAPLLSHALTSPIDGVEFDLRKTADGVVVLHHDRRIKLHDERYHFVDKMTYNELRRIVGDELLTFEEAVKTVTSYKLRVTSSRFVLDLDLKQAGIEKDVAQILRNAHFNGRVIVCSVDVGILQAFADEYPQAGLGLTLEPMIDRWDLWNNKAFIFICAFFYFSVYPFAFRIIRRKSTTGDFHLFRLFRKGLTDADISYASIYYKVASRKVIQLLHDLGMKVLVYGTDNSKNVQKLTRLGIDGIKIKRKG